MFLGHSDEISQRINILDKDSTKVANDTVGHIVVGRVTATEDESPTVEYPALGIIGEIHRHGILSSSIVSVL